SSPIGPGRLPACLDAQAEQALRQHQLFVRGQLLTLQARQLEAVGGRPTPEMRARHSRDWALLTGQQLAEWEALTGRTLTELADLDDHLPGLADESPAATSPEGAVATEAALRGLVRALRLATVDVEFDAP